MFDLHTHTTFSDGRNSPEEMVLSAIGMGMSTLGISDHSYTSFDESYCIPRHRLEEYKACIRMLKEKYRDRIELRLGLEKDYYSDTVDDGCDYFIGSVHYMKIGEEYVPVDRLAKTLIDAAARYFGGDIYSLAEIYYSTVKVWEHPLGDCCLIFAFQQFRHTRRHLYAPHTGLGLGLADAVTATLVSHIFYLSILLP